MSQPRFYFIDKVPKPDPPVANRQNFRGCNTFLSLPLPDVKQAISILLACCILGQASVRTFWVVHYQWNRAVYLSHCENKSKPALHCNGKCQLRKKMEVKSGNTPGEPRLPDSFHQIKDLQLFFESYTPLLQHAGVRPHLPSFPLYRAFYPDAPKMPLFKPPAAA